MTFASAALLAISARDALPAVDATLNAVATVLLLVGYALINASPRARPQADDAFGFRRLGAFLACYLWYHFGVLRGQRGTPFAGPPPISYIYYGC